MIKITSFYPFRGFLRVTQEFHEHKAFVRMKSLTFESQFEFEYIDVSEITDSFYANSSQITFGFLIVAFTGFTLALFCNVIYANPILLRIEQILYACGLLLFITGFKKSWFVYIADRNDNILTYLKQTRQNRDFIPQVIEMIKNKSENAEEFTSTSPFPNERPLFEHIEYDISNWKRTTDRFYENEMIGFQESIFGESVYNIKYRFLNGKIYRGKSGNDVVGLVLIIVILVVAIFLGFLFGFSMIFGITLPIKLSSLLLSLFALFLLSIPLGLIKQEVIGLYNDNGKLGYWTYVNRKNQVNIEKIVAFIQSKIPAEK